MTRRHPLLGSLPDDVEEADIVEVLEKPQRLVGRVWDEERNAPVPDAPDPPPITVNGTPMDSIIDDEGNRVDPTGRQLLRMVASKMLRVLAKKLDPDD